MPSQVHFLLLLLVGKAEAQVDHLSMYKNSVVCPCENLVHDTLLVS
jgi:hypothetical protein